MRNVLFSTFALALAVACGRKEEKKVSPQAVPMPQNSPTPQTGDDTGGGMQQFALQGEAMGVDGGRIDLASFKDRNLVLFFAADTCQVCAQEARKVRDFIAGTPAADLKVDLVTVVVGSIQADTQEWRDSLGVTWPVGYTESADLVRRYCPAIKTPCIIVHTPQAGVVLARNGEIGIDEIQRFSGDWK